MLLGAYYPERGGVGVLRMFNRPGSSNGRQKSKTIKNPSGFQQNPKKSLDQDLAPQKSHAEFPNLNGIQYTAKSKKVGLVIGYW